MEHLPKPTVNPSMPGSATFSRPYLSGLTVGVYGGDTWLVEPLHDALDPCGYALFFYADVESLQVALTGGNLDVLFLGHEPPHLNGVELFREVKSFTRRPAVVLFGNHPELSDVVQAMKLGAADFFSRGNLPQGENLLNLLDDIHAQHRLAAIEGATRHALQKESTLLSIVINTIPHFVFWKDVHSIYRGCNTNFSRSARLNSPDELIGKSDYDLYWRDWAHLFLEQDRIVLGGTPVRDREIVWQNEKGEKVTYLSNAVPLKEADGTIIGLISIFVDITYLKDLETNIVKRGIELQEKNHELEQKNAEILRVQEQMIAREKMASLGSMAAGIAHEIRNPLNFIQNLSLLNVEHSEEAMALLRKDVSSLEPILLELVDLLELIRDNSNIVTRHGERASQIVVNMMALATEATDQFIWYNLNDLVTEQVQLLVRSHQRTSEIKLAVHLDPTLEFALVRPHDLGRAFNCVLMNALEAVLCQKDAFPGFEPAITVTTYHDKSRLCLKVEDNGHGFDETVEKQMFLPFFTTRPGFGGNPGLGLAICYDLVVNKHQGAIEASSEPGNGAVFILCLPKSE